MTPGINPLLPDYYDLVWVLMSAVALVFVVAALVSIGRFSKRLAPNHALIWALLAIFVPVLGPLAWFVVGRRTALLNAGALVGIR